MSKLRDHTVSCDRCLEGESCSDAEIAALKDVLFAHEYHIQQLEDRVWSIESKLGIEHREEV